MMTTRSLQLGLTAWLLAALAGCASFDRHGAIDGDEAPKKLLAWEVGPKDKDKDKDKNKNGNGEEAEPERDTIATDRPDFTEASTAVGRGRVQLESGYTYTRDAGGAVSHSYPEALLRIGMFADWFELRIGQNIGGERGLETKTFIHGGQDLYLGLRFDLTEQKGPFPESSLILQTTVPSGHRSFSADQMLPGFNLLYGWDIVEDKWTAGASTQVNRRVDDASHFYAEFAQSFTVGYKWTKKLGQYTEWFTLVPTGANAGASTQHYLDGGFTYLITDNFQLDIRAGVGLNRASDDLFAGSGFAVRY